MAASTAARFFIIIDKKIVKTIVFPEKCPLKLKPQKFCIYSEISQARPQSYHSHVLKSTALNLNIVIIKNRIKVKVQLYVNSPIHPDHLSTKTVLL